MDSKSCAVVPGVTTMSYGGSLTVREASTTGARQQHLRPLNLLQCWWGHEVAVTTMPILPSQMAFIRRRKLVIQYNTTFAPFQASVPIPLSFAYHASPRMSWPQSTYSTSQARIRYPLHARILVHVLPQSSQTCHFFIQIIDIWVSNRCNGLQSAVNFAHTIMPYPTKG